MDRKQIEEILWGIFGKYVEDVRQEDIGQNDELADLGVDSIALSCILTDMEESLTWISPNRIFQSLKPLATQSAI